MAKQREVIEVQGLDHGANPIPVGVAIGGMLFTGTVSGVDRSTGDVPADKEAEFSNAFENLGAVLSAGGSSWRAVAKIEVLLKDKGDRLLVNAEWLKKFPDEADRPVRHVSAVELPGALNIQLEVVAFLDRE